MLLSALSDIVFSHRPSVRRAELAAVKSAGCAPRRCILRVDARKHGGTTASFDGGRARPCTACTVAQVTGIRRSNEEISHHSAKVPRIINVAQIPYADFADHLGNASAMHLYIRAFDETTPHSGSGRHMPGTVLARRTFRARRWQNRVLVSRCDEWVPATIDIGRRPICHGSAGGDSQMHAQCCGRIRHNCLIPGSISANLGSGSLQ